MNSQSFLPSISAFFGVLWMLNAKNIPRKDVDLEYMILHSHTNFIHNFDKYMYGSPKLSKNAFDQLSPFSHDKRDTAISVDLPKLVTFQHYLPIKSTDFGKEIRPNNFL